MQTAYFPIGTMLKSRYLSDIHVRVTETLDNPVEPDIFYRLESIEHPAVFFWIRESQLRAEYRTS